MLYKTDTFAKLLRDTL